jgi:hypothetical protein
MIRIGDPDAFLEIVRLDPEARHAVCRIVAGARDNSGEFRGSVVAVVLDNSDEVKKSLEHFRTFAASSAEVQIFVVGWLRLKRSSRGLLTVAYRFGREQLGVTLEGEISVDGEFADRFCRDLACLLWPRSPTPPP